MNVGRLAWRTPTGAMLWEIWGRHKVSFLWQGVALAAAFALSAGKNMARPKFPRQCWPWPPWLLRGGLPSFAGLFRLCGDGRRQSEGWLSRSSAVETAPHFPLGHGADAFRRTATTTMLDIWVAFVLKPLGFLPVYDLFWISTVLLSFFWWMQALAWSLPLVRFRSSGHGCGGPGSSVGWGDAAVALLNISPGWQWGILAALLVSAVPAAWIGLKLMRQGRWDGPSRISMFWSRCAGPGARPARKKFGSAFGAQFWLEWRRQGWLLPGISGAMALVVFPLLFFVRIQMGGAWDAPPPEAILALMLIGPLCFPV